MTVEAVTVGDCELDEDLGALLAAAREATVNAAKWSGADVVSVFAEVEPEAEVSVFVRDRGRGFDPAAVPGDRKGLAESVHARMARRGGSATVRSAPGEGTEVSLPCRGPPASASRAGHEHARRARHRRDGAPGRPRVVIVDDHGLFRSGVRSELGDQVEVVGEAEDVEPAIAADRARPARRGAARRAPARRRRAGGGQRGQGRRSRRCASWPCPPRTRPRT